MSTVYIYWIIYTWQLYMYMYQFKYVTCVQPWPAKSFWMLSPSRSRVTLSVWPSSKHGSKKGVFPLAPFRQTSSATSLQGLTKMLSLSLLGFHARQTLHVGVNSCQKHPVLKLFFPVALNGSQIFCEAAAGSVRRWQPAGPCWQQVRPGQTALPHLWWAPKSVKGSSL